MNEELYEYLLNINKKRRATFVHNARILEKPLIDHYKYTLKWLIEMMTDGYLIDHQFMRKLMEVEQILRN
jgi:hypothetical protein